MEIKRAKYQKALDVLEENVSIQGCEGRMTRERRYIYVMPFEKYLAFTQCNCGTIEEVLFSL